MSRSIYFYNVLYDSHLQNELANEINKWKWGENIKTGSFFLVFLESFQLKYVMSFSVLLCGEMSLLLVVAVKFGCFNESLFFFPRISRRRWGGNVWGCHQKIDREEHKGRGEVEWK